MAARRIFEIAKELGIDSKAIVTKCHLEGIPETTIRNHMSTVSAGLEASIREWFSGEPSSSTAVETTAHVDLEQVKKTTTRKRATKKGEAEGGGTATAVETHTDHAPTPAPTAAAPAAPSAPEPTPARAVAIKPEPKPAEPKVEAKAPDHKHEAKAPETKAPDAKSDEAVEVKPATRIAPTVTPIPTPSAPTAPKAPPMKLGPTTITPVAPAAKAPDAPGTGAPAGSGTGSVGRPGAASGPGGPGSGSAAMPNVPTRPTVVSPAGPKLEVKTPVKLSGPKIVRVEAPEQLEAPRPRRFGPGSGPGGPGGPGTLGPRGPRPGYGEGGGEDDRGGARRGPGAGAANSNNKKRSSGQGVPDRRRGISGQDWVGGGQIFSEQDLIEREARLLRAGGFLKKRRQDMNKKPGDPQTEERHGRIQIAAPFTIKDLSAATGVKAADIVKKLFLQGVMATINSGIEVSKAIEIMMDFDIEIEVTEAKTGEEAVSEEYEDRQALDERARGPIVTILGHVDHGKTSLLDKIRTANVAAGEAGGITQRTSAFRVSIEVEGAKKEVVFLDTPGHEAFTSMRSRGAKLTDIVVLVVSAPEGVMPQTIESINHAKAAGVPIVVALNKIDRPDATEQAIQRVLGDLAKAGLNPVPWGGDTEIIRTSANTGQGIKELLETLDYQAQLLSLKADFGGHARGTVIEARQVEGRGAVANILVQHGKLEVGTFIVAGRAFGRVRDITDDRGNRLKEALPPMPVQISGIDVVPDAGDRFYIVESLKEAQEAAEQRRHREREAELAQPKATLDNLFSQISDKDVKEILVVVKAAEQGTVDVLKHEIEKIKTDEAKTRVLHSAVGGITESDVLLAEASRAVIIGFNVIPSGKARQLAEAKGVEIRTYDVIYDITDDMRKAVEGMLAPELRQEILGHAEVRQVFRISKVGSIAGCYITDGTVQRDALIRVTRNGIVIENDRRLEQLKRFKDDAKEVRMGMECGMKIVGYDDIKEGDILECYKQVEVKRTL
ncbi:MAG: translation initiation factor IF-2 [Planctomycetota bacterium]|nr:translation initiation factor IF-2 [Planctomycetota bacterium]